ncbi:hypothetical protein LAV60_15595 [Clostridium sporogenes]|uniref:anaerobic ribonucleoside-triphosphate reductase n=1 Tax=Clostridium sporogenes TaxID=1509 RepID=UPI00223803A4|nr:anaerobic ribonucleoside-triphosphate reductase [Clostridium sporogenes]MCW6094595.1 hypothetical protein [Clostridium sporogenes]
MFNNSQEIIKKFTSNAEDKQADYLKRENSNFVYSIALLRHNIGNQEEEKYLMNEIFSPELVELYRKGYIYPHDKKLAPYCVSLGCKDIATNGIPTIAKNMLSSAPTKRVSKLLRHFSNAVVLMSQQASGAVMLSQMTTIVASYLHYEETVLEIKWTAEDLREEIQSLIWELNMPLRSGSQSAFSNITLEFGKASAEIENDYVVIGGQFVDYQYKDIPAKYFDRVNKAIIDVMAKGNNGIPFTFPLITVPITDNFDFDNNMFLYLLDKMYNWGGCYFENFRTAPYNIEKYKQLNPFLKAKDPSVSRSLCCRLNIDLELLSQLGGGVFGSSSGSTGAVQVINMNINRLLIEHGYSDSLFETIADIMEVMQEGHQAKRKWIENNRELYPTFFAYNRDLKNYFNVFAITGMHEGLINAGYAGGMKSEEGQKVAHKIMQYMTKIVNSFIQRDKVACGIEYAPSENAGIKMARDDRHYAKSIGKEIFTQGEGDEVFLTAGCMLPFSEEDFTEQLENASQFQAYATSGSVLHHFVEVKLEPKILAKYISNAFDKPINYITISTSLAVCGECGTRFIAEDGVNIHECPNCGSDDIITFSRVIGYVKAVSRKSLRVAKGIYEGEYNFWSKARRRDWAERKRLKLDTFKEITNDEIFR